MWPVRGTFTWAKKAQKWDWGDTWGDIWEDIFTDAKTKRSLGGDIWGDIFNTFLRDFARHFARFNVKTGLFSWVLRGILHEKRDFRTLLFTPFRSKIWSYLFFNREKEAVSFIAP